MMEIELKTYEECFEGIDVKGEKIDYMNDFEIIDNIIIFTARSHLFFLKFCVSSSSDKVVEFSKRGRINLGHSFDEKKAHIGKLQVDHRKRILIVGSNYGRVIRLKIGDDDDTQKNKPPETLRMSDIQIPNCEGYPDGGISALKMNVYSRCLVVASGWKAKSKVCVVKGYEENTPTVVQLRTVELRASIKAFGFLKTIKNCVVMAGGDYDHDDEKDVEDFRFLVYNLAEGSTVHISEHKYINQPIRDLTTFVKRSCSQEFVITCSDDRRVVIWKLDGSGDVFENIRKREVHSAIILVSNRIAIMGGIYGSLFGVFMDDKNNNESYRFERMGVEDKERKNVISYTGRFRWYKETNFLFSIHGDTRIKVYEVKNVERDLRECEWERLYSMNDEDVRERVDYILNQCSQEDSLQMINKSVVFQKMFQVRLLGQHIVFNFPFVFLTL